MGRPRRTFEVLDADSVQYTWLTPCHFGCMISGPYPDGRRVIWSNGRQTINKLDYDTLEILAEHAIEGGEGKTPQAELEDNLRGLDEKEGWEAIEHAIGLSLKYMTGLDGVYALVDCDNTFFLGRVITLSPISTAIQPTRPLPLSNEIGGTSPITSKASSSASTSPSTVGS